MKSGEVQGCKYAFCLPMVAAEMSRKPDGPLRRGWTTGACATAATRAALMMLWGEGRPERVRITLPKGERPEFDICHWGQGDGWAEAGVIKDAGDDPDVTHGAQIIARVAASDGGVLFQAGVGVGIVTMAGLPIAVGEPAINPVPRQMLVETVEEMAGRLGQVPDIEITISVPGGPGWHKRRGTPDWASKAGFQFWAPPALCGRFPVPLG